MPLRPRRGRAAEARAAVQKSDAPAAATRRYVGSSPAGTRFRSLARTAIPPASAAEVQAPVKIVNHMRLHPPLPPGMFAARPRPVPARSAKTRYIHDSRPAASARSVRSHTAALPTLTTAPAAQPNRRPTARPNDRLSSLAGAATDVPTPQLDTPPRRLQTATTTTVRTNRFMRASSEPNEGSDTYSENLGAPSTNHSYGPIAEASPTHPLDGTSRSPNRTS